MTTPSLGQVLAQEPAVADIINSMTELLPGVSANEENAKVSLDSITKNPNDNITLFSSPEPFVGYSVSIRPYMLKKKYMMTATVMGPSEEWTMQGLKRE